MRDVLRLVLGQAALLERLLEQLVGLLGRDGAFLGVGVGVGRRRNATMLPPRVRAATVAMIAVR